MARSAGVALLLVSPLFAPAQAAEACPFSVSDLEPSAPSEAHPLHLGHGVNLSQWWEDDVDRAPTADELANVRDLDLTFVRLPLSPTWLQEKDPSAQQVTLARLHCDLVSILHAKLNVVLDLHPSMAWDTKFTGMKPDKAVQRLTDLWRELAPVLHDLPTDRVLISLYNEPAFEPATWWEMQGQLIKNVRAFFPHSTLIVTPSPDGGWWKLVDMQPYADPDLIYDFHYYEPMVLTHHGADWLPGYSKARAASPLPYPVDPSFAYNLKDPAISAYVKDQWGPGEIDSLLRQVAAWRDRHHVEVACLEYGIYRPHLDAASRLGWLHDVRTDLDTYHLPWAVWEYRGPFGFIETGRDFDEDMAKALGLRHSAAP